MLLIRNLFLVIFLFCCISAHSQTACELIKSYSLATCNRDTVKALSDLEKFRQLYPNDSLIEDVNLAVAELYFGKGELEKSKQISNKMVSKKMDAPLGGFNQCPFVYESTECRRQIFVVSDFRELQYKACMNLYAVYTAQGNYDSAMYFLKKAETEFTCPPYLPSDCRKNMLLRYSAAYESKNDFDNAINVLVPYLLTEPITDRLLYLLKKYSNFDALKMAYENIEDSISIEYGPVSENPTVTYEKDENGRILRTLSVEEYGRTAYWHFLGQKFAITGVNDYKSHRANGESRKRKLVPVKTDSELIQEAKSLVQQTGIYKLIYQ
jgi:tetratricopeptide (TPR) repeat protein